MLNWEDDQLFDDGNLIFPWIGLSSKLIRTPLGEPAAENKPNLVNLLFRPRWLDSRFQPEDIINSWLKTIMLGREPNKKHRSLFSKVALQMNLQEGERVEILTEDLQRSTYPCVIGVKIKFKDKKERIGIPDLYRQDGTRIQVETPKDNSLGAKSFEGASDTEMVIEGSAYLDESEEPKIVAVKDYLIIPILSPTDVLKIAIEKMGSDFNNSYISFEIKKISNHDLRNPTIRSMIEKANPHINFKQPREFILIKKKGNEILEVRSLYDGVNPKRILEVYLRWAIQSGDLEWAVPDSQANLALEALTSWINSDFTREIRGGRKVVWPMILENVLLFPPQTKRTEWGDLFVDLTALGNEKEQFHKIRKFFTGKMNKNIIAKLLQTPTNNNLKSTNIIELIYGEKQKEIDYNSVLTWKNVLCEAHSRQWLMDIVSLIGLDESVDRLKLTTWIYTILIHHFAVYHLRLLAATKHVFQQLEKILHGSPEFEPLPCDSCNLTENSLAECPLAPKFSIQLGLDSKKRPLRSRKIHGLTFDFPRHLIFINAIRAAIIDIWPEQYKEFLNINRENINRLLEEIQKIIQNDEKKSHLIKYFKIHATQHLIPVSKTHLGLVKLNPSTGHVEGREEFKVGQILSKIRNETKKSFIPKKPPTKYKTEFEIENHLMNLVSTYAPIIQKNELMGWMSLVVNEIIYFKFLSSSSKKGVWEAISYMVARRPFSFGRKYGADIYFEPGGPLLEAFAHLAAIETNSSEPLLADLLAVLKNRGFEFVRGGVEMIIATLEKQGLLESEADAGAGQRLTNIAYEILTSNEMKHDKN